MALFGLVNATMNATMRGVVYQGHPFQMTVQDLPLPVVQDPTDAVVRITMSALCGSDLHVYHGVSGGVPPWTMGHEAVGYIEEIGSAVSAFDVGDYVIIPDTANHGQVQMEPEPLDFFGNGAGLSAVTANTTNVTVEQDYLTVSDIFGTAWTALDFSGFEPGDTVAVFGAGPVGLLAAYSAILRGASRVYSVDHVPQRLERVASIGAVPIDFAESDPVEQILAHEPSGVMRAVDCVGMEALNAQLNHQQDIVVQQMISATHVGGGIGQVGVWMAQDDSPGAPLGHLMSPSMDFPLSDFFSKRLKFQAGPVDPKKVAPQLVELIQTGRARPSFIETATIGIEEVPEYYGRFNRTEEIKVYIRFP
ncbi:hypothetical protein ASPBRDRAFT_34115 [Aspergillus brasiliensis CBS 101740]|uniref:Uncharacterized protein n=1 Tax=Aspergillus brasiliensis (strain CBS 101740 / IMI 381727 / IBT 21946) TaxID=767769 RepID=A0A1L9U7V3_ASPBC|nr:hypothetical protein ASPBRDRAFT_34115 [Aspergillus brasiliensis CBS 101740]